MASKFTRLKISKFSGVARLNLVVFALLFAGVGAYLIVTSKAATTLGTGNVSFHLTDEMTGAGIAGVDLRIRATNDAQYCATPYATSNGKGDITFTNCSLHLAGPSDHYYVYYNSAPGYSYSSRPAGNYNAYDTLLTGSNGTKSVTYYNFPSATISASPTSVAYGGSSNITFKGYYSDRCLFKTGQNNPGNVNPGTTFNTGALTADQIYTLYCYNSGRGWNSADASATVTVGAPPVIIPPLGHASIASFTAPATVAYPNTVSLSGQASAQSCTINGAAVTVFVSNEVWSLQSGPNKTNPTSYTLSCVDSDGQAVTSTRSVTVTGVPGGGNCTSNCGGTVDPPPKAGGTNGRTTARTGGVATTGADKTKPTVPTNFQAEQFGSGEVDLSWDASTDNIAVEAYELERSTDQTEWTKLDDAISDTSYTDSTADYATTYTYRLSAKDTAGNFSDYALVDITTNDFTANAYADEDSTISSDDGLVEITIPAGALSEDSFCEISKDSTRVSPKGYKLATGGYSVSCRNKAGDSVTSFDKAAKVTMHLKSFKKFKNFKAYSVDGNNLSPIESSFNKNTGDLTFNLSELQTFAAFGAKGGSAWYLWILFPLLLIGLVLLILRIRNNRGGSADDYYDTTNYVAMPPSAPVAPTDAVVGGYQHHPSLPEMVAQNPQPQAGYPAPPLVPGQQAPQYPPDTDPNQQ